MGPILDHAVSQQSCYSFTLLCSLSFYNTTLSEVPLAPRYLLCYIIYGINNDIVYDLSSDTERMVCLLYPPLWPFTTLMVIYTGCHAPANAALSDRILCGFWHGDFTSLPIFSVSACSAFLKAGANLDLSLHPPVPSPEYSPPRSKTKNWPIYDLHVRNHQHKLLSCSVLKCATLVSWCRND